MTTPKFTTESVAIRYLIGEVLIGTRNLRLAVRKSHFSNESLFGSSLCDGWSELPSDADGFLFPSHLVQHRLRRLSFSNGRVQYVPVQTKRYYIDLTTSFDEYMQKFSAKSRSTLRRKLRSFEKLSDGKVDWRTFRGPTAIQEFYRLASPLSATTYQERLLNGGLPNTDAFKTNMLDLADRDEVVGYLLFLNSVPVAYLYTPLQNGIFKYQFLGYDSSISKYSPGTVLQYLVLEELFSDASYKMFDFTEGEGGQKAFFGTGHVDCADIYILRRTLKNVLTVVTHLSLDRFSESIVTLLDSIGLKSRLKKYFRANWSSTKRR